MKILILGIQGMLGNTLFQFLSTTDKYKVYGTQRREILTDTEFILQLDVLDTDNLQQVMLDVKPELVINCTGVIKQKHQAIDPLKIIPINSLFPHRIAHLCQLSAARLVHISTDCIFSGTQGNYVENTPMDASDLYGMSKYLGEVGNLSNTLTLRTSIIGHATYSNLQLVDWFLEQKGSIHGYRKAIFSGIPTIEIARIFHRYIIQNSSLCGIYHLSADAISKYDLLKIIKQVYNKDIEIIPDDKVEIDRSLNSSRFRDATGYQPPKWPELVSAMHQCK